jgi:tRNA 2-selenouridine synthase SelU
MCHKQKVICNFLSIVSNYKQKEKRKKKKMLHSNIANNIKQTTTQPLLKNWRKSREIVNVQRNES